MKKEYLQPRTKAVATKHTLPIAASAPSLIVDKDGGAAPGSFETKEQNDWNIWSN